MNKRKILTVFLACLAGAAVCDVAQAHPYGARARVGVYVGLPLFWPYWGPPYPAYYPPYPERVVVVRPEPQVYVEQPGPSPAPETGYWYYCAAAGAYYPYVKECAAGWQRVPPRPAGE